MFLLVLFFSAVDLALTLALAVETHSSRPYFEHHSHSHFGRNDDDLNGADLSNQVLSPSLNRSTQLSTETTLQCQERPDRNSAQEALDGFDTETDFDPLQGLNVIERLSFSRIFDDYNRLMDANDKILQDIKHRTLLVFEKNQAIDERTRLTVLETQEIEERIRLTVLKTQEIEKSNRLAFEALLADIESFE
jgi:hypothetical protein